MTTKADLVITAVLKWRTANREHAKLGADNYFNHSPEREKTFRDSSKRLRKLGERMHKLLDEYEQQTSS